MFVRTLASLSMALATCLPTTHCSGQTVVDNSVFVQCQERGECGLSVIQDAARTDSTGVLFEVAETRPGFANLTLGAGNIDEGSDWFVTNQGDEFSQRSVMAGDHIPWGANVLGGGPRPSNVVEVTMSIATPGAPGGPGGGILDQPFYLGVNTGQGFTGFQGPVRDAFGWALIQIDLNLNMEVLDSAVAYNAGGIIVGQRTAIQAVPEPSLLPLLSSAVLCVLHTTRRRRASTLNV